MRMIVLELYEALKKAGVEDDLARAAAKGVVSVEDKSQLATKPDLADLRTDLIKWNVGAMVALTAIFAVIVGFVR